MIKLAMCYPSRVKENNAIEFLFPPLGIAYLARHTPDHYKISVYDEIVGEDINPDMLDADLVAMSSLSFGISRAYALSDKLRIRGITTVVGGLHASALPEEALLHFDSVIMGEGEQPWREFLTDFERGNYKKSYFGPRNVSLENLGTPRRDLIHPNYHCPSVQTSRGCPCTCSFCFQTIFKKRKYRFIPHDTVLEDIDSVKDNYIVVLSDDNFIGYSENDIEDRKILLEKMIRRNYKFYWSTATTIRLAEDSELMSLMYRAGCRAAFIGFETVNDEGHREMNKRQNLGVDYKDAVKKIHKHKLSVIASVILGMDSHGNDYHKILIKELKRYNIEFLRVNFMTAYPGTPFYDKMEKENRVSNDWDILRPEIPSLKFKHYTHEEALKARKEIIKSFFSLPNIINTISRWIFREWAFASFFIKIILRNKIYEKIRHRRASNALTGIN